MQKNEKYVERQECFEYNQIDRKYNYFIKKLIYIRGE